MSDRKVTLNIDRLVLRGIDPLDQRALTDALQTELGRVLREPSVRDSLSSRRTPVLRLGRMPMQPGLAGARQLGTQVARGIGKGIKP